MSEVCCPDNGFDKWKVKNAYRTLQEAEEIKADSDLMEQVKIIADEELGNAKKITSILGIKKEAQRLKGLKQDEEDKE